MNPVSLPPMRWAAAVLAALAFVLALLAAAAPAFAQTLSCERVPYNQRIIVVCTSEDTDSPTSSTPTPTPTPEDAEDDSDESAPDDDASEEDSGDDESEDDSELDDDESTSADDEKSDDQATGEESVDRGDRGDRTPGPGEPEGESDAGATDSSGVVNEETGAVFGADDEDSADSPSDTSSFDGGDTGDTGDDEPPTSGNLILTTNSEPGVLPVAAGFALLAGVGAVFLLAARRENSSGPA